MKNIRIRKFKKRVTGEIVKVVSGEELQEHHGETLFGQPILDKNVVLPKGYSLERKKYYPQSKLFAIGQEFFTEYDMIVYSSLGIQVFELETFTNIFEEVFEFGEENIKISSKGILRATEKVYLNLNNCSSIVIDEDTIILKSDRLIPIERKEVEHFDKIKELIKSYIEE